MEHMSIEQVAEPIEWDGLWITSQNIFVLVNKDKYVCVGHPISITRPLTKNVSTFYGKVIERHRGPEQKKTSKGLDWPLLKTEERQFLGI